MKKTIIGLMICMVFASTLCVFGAETKNQDTEGIDYMVLVNLEGKEYITGYAYEPWHIRYLDNTEAAQNIMSQPGMTLEVWLGAIRDLDPEIDYGTSELYALEDLEEAAVRVKCQFAFFENCELVNLRYVGDECMNEENLSWLNELAEGKDYTQAAEFFCDFQTGDGSGPVLEPNTEYKDYQWWLARRSGEGWQLIRETMLPNIIWDSYITLVKAEWNKTILKLQSGISCQLNRDMPMLSMSLVVCTRLGQG